MSEPKRYTPTEMVCVKCNQPDADLQMAMQTDGDGEWVKWKDYKKLEAEFSKYHNIVKTKHADLYLQNTRLKAENERLRASSFVTAVPSADYDKLKAENERLNTLLSIAERNIKNLLRTPEWTQIAELTADYRDLEAENRRLRKAGDRMAAALNGDYNHELDCVKEWNAAKQPPTDKTK